MSKLAKKAYSGQISAFFSHSALIRATLLTYNTVLVMACFSLTSCATLGANPQSSTLPGGGSFQIGETNLLPFSIAAFIVYLFLKIKGRKATPKPTKKRPNPANWKEASHA